ncbi:MAG TPA: ATP-binding protein [Spirochaetota bacterium]|nr:ATP-binding protein [Spirochaetota bacterium]HPC43161.1 ATP-binding protein [Spirochaetota bacterium]HPL16362.1 ATP-binding protein [Spirochaetota bacterium]HQF10059.1 ATP-binding protein [Spirochaetota bacterium]HQH98798.1 ATP-binding protein [Spirochaetota bacterium]
MLVFEKTIPSTREASRSLIREALEFFSLLKRKGYASGVSEFTMRLVMDEALENAIRHGNRYNEEKIILFRLMGNKKKVSVTVQDQGGGFHPDRLPDPLHGNNRFAPGGRGLLLMSNIGIVTWNAEGNCVSIELPR